MRVWSGVSTSKCVCKKIEPEVGDRVSRARSSCEDVARIRDPLPECGSFPPNDGVQHGSKSTNVIKLSANECFNFAKCLEPDH